MTQNYRHKYEIRQTSLYLHLSSLIPTLNWQFSPLDPYLERLLRMLVRNKFPRLRLTP